MRLEGSTVLSADSRGMQLEGSWTTVATEERASDHADQKQPVDKVMRGSAPAQ